MHNFYFPLAKPNYQTTMHQLTIKLCTNTACISVIVARLADDGHEVAEAEAELKAITHMAERYDQLADLVGINEWYCTYQPSSEDCGEDITCLSFFGLPAARFG